MARILVPACLLLVALAACSSMADATAKPAISEAPKEGRVYAVTKTNEEWLQQLGPARYHVLREAGTERAFTGEYWDHHEDGTYVCAGCRQKLFASADKFESGSGWPSYTRPVGKDAVAVHRDTSHGMVREEVVCSNCGGHLGHVFDDGPAPTGLRYCINSASLLFEKGNKLGAK